MNYIDEIKKELLFIGLSPIYGKIEPSIVYQYADGFQIIIDIVGPIFEKRGYSKIGERYNTHINYISPDKNYSVHIGLFTIAIFNEAKRKIYLDRH